MFKITKERKKENKGPKNNNLEWTPALTQS
jgi:hypothetical protein